MRQVFAFADDSACPIGEAMLSCVAGLVLDERTVSMVEDSFWSFAEAGGLPPARGKPGPRNIMLDPVHCKDEYLRVAQFCDRTLNLLGYLNVPVVLSAVVVDDANGRPPRLHQHEANFRAAYAFLRGLDHCMMSLGGCAQLVYAEDSSSEHNRKFGGTGNGVGRRKNDAERKNEDLWGDHVEWAKNANGSSIGGALQHLLWAQSEHAHRYGVFQPAIKPLYDVPIRGIRDRLFSLPTCGFLPLQVADVVAFTLRRHIWARLRGDAASGNTPEFDKTLHFFIAKCIRLFSFTEVRREGAVAVAENNLTALLDPPNETAVTALLKKLRGEAVESTAPTT